MTDLRTSQDARGDGIAQADRGSTAIVAGPGATVTISSLSTRKLWRLGVIVILVLLACWVAYIVIHHPPATKLKGVAGEWLYDNYVRLRIPKGTVGTLLSEKSYDLEMDLTNRTSMELEVTKIVVEKYSHVAALVFGQDKDIVHTSESNLLESIKPNGTITVSIDGNEILPTAAVVKIYHTLSGEPSTFEVDLGGKRMPMPPPRQLPVQVIYRGADALSAVAEATKTATAWGKKVTIVAAFPGDNETFIDPDSRLKFVVVKDWVVTFYSFTLDQLYTVIVKENRVEGKGYPRSEEDSGPLPEQGVEAFGIGNQQALAIANQANLLCADWKDGPRLSAIKVGRTWKAAWFLPYRGPDSLPVIVDATTGDLIAINGAKGFVPRTNERLHPEE
jgi:hypothetical protein